MNKTVSLMRYCKTEDGWKRLPAVMGGNGRVRPGYVKVDGKIVEYPQGNYQLRYYIGSKVKYTPAGDDASGALLKLKQMELTLKAQDAADEADGVLVTKESRVDLAAQLKRFVQTVEDRGSKVAAKAYKLSADEFLTVTGKRYADELTTDDIGAYHRALRKRGVSARTIHNRHAAVKPFLRFCGLDTDKLAPKSPGYEEKRPEVYTDDELKTFFASPAMDSYSKLAFNLMLRCGLREQEAMFLCWPDIEFSTKTLMVRGKVDLGFAVKDKAQREVPLDGELLLMLKERKEAHPNDRLVLATSTGKPNTKLLLLLKRRVRAAGLNCGGCEGCRDREECSGWYLHKFRSTYCTKLLRSGLDVSSVQALMGHSDLQATQRYLSPLDVEAVRARVGAINWAGN